MKSYINDDEPFSIQNIILDDTLSLFLYKRWDFREDKEVRCIITERNKNQSVGVEIPVTLNDLIKTVHIDPNAPIYFSDMIKSFTNKYGWNFNIRTSAMAEPRNSNLEKALR